MSVSDRAVKWIDDQSAETPFLLSVHYTAPHWPWETRDDREEALRISPKISHVDGGSLDKYWRMIHHMDEGIGRILAALEAKGLSDNTLVIFTSDNGGERYSNNWPFVGGKMDLLEGGLRVPLVARWPARIKAGGVSATPNLTMDWTATMLAAAGVEPMTEEEVAAEIKAARTERRARQAEIGRASGRERVLMPV